MAIYIGHHVIERAKISREGLKIQGKGNAGPKNEKAEALEKKAQKQNLNRGNITICVREPDKSEASRSEAISYFSEDERKLNAQNYLFIYLYRAQSVRFPIRIRMKIRQTHNAKLAENTVNLRRPNGGREAKPNASAVSEGCFPASVIRVRENLKYVGF